MEKIPTLDLWMLNTICDALQKEYDRSMKDGGYARGLKRLQKEKGFDAAVTAEKEIQQNNHTAPGKIWLSIKRIEEIKEAYTLAFEKN